MTACPACGSTRVMRKLRHEEHGTFLVRACGTCGVVLPNEAAAATERGDGEKA